MDTNTYNESEYNALREELIKRIEMRQNIVSLVVATAGVLMGFSVQTPPLALLYPPLCLFMCIMWAQNDVRALQISDYLHSLENDQTKLGWTKFYRHAQGSGSFLPGLPFSVMAPGGIFVLTSIMALGLSLSGPTLSRSYRWLLACDLIAILLMMLLVLKVRHARLSRRTESKAVE